MIRNVQSPFYIDEDDESPEETANAMQVASHVCRLLRTNRGFWKTLVAHLPPCTGSLSTELLVILDSSNTPFCLRANAGPDVDRLMHGMVNELTKQGISAIPSRRMASAVLDHVVSLNTRTIHACHTIAVHSREAKLVFRISLKSVRDVSMNPSTNTVWFRNGHANLGVLNSTSKLLFLVEPTGTEVVRALDGLLHASIIPDHVRRLFRVVHNFNMFHPSSRAANDDNMCTAWCAITAMLIMANDVDGPEAFWAVAKWTQTHRSSLLRNFFKFACYVLKTSVLLQPQLAA